MEDTQNIACIVDKEVWKRGEKGGGRPYRKGACVTSL
jgi:hypothetical protein